jgi:hypothetical protein
MLQSYPNSKSSKSRTTIKSQALADFMADWMPPAQSNPQSSNQTWTVFTDGAWGQALELLPYWSHHWASDQSMQQD